jgi:hypothetical protein
MQNQYRTALAESKELEHTVRGLEKEVSVSRRKILKHQAKEMSVQGAKKEAADATHKRKELEDSCEKVQRRCGSSVCACPRE